MSDGITPLTREPKTAFEWLENVRSRGGKDADWAHRIIRSEQQRGGYYLKDMIL